MVLRDYAPLPFTLLRAGSGYAQPTQVVAEQVTLEEPALAVMTDLRALGAVIILSGDSVEEAHRRMIQRGVRLLLVVDQNRQVVGVITASDILGEKPMQAVTQRGIRREELLVRDIMTAQGQLEAIDLENVRASRGSTRSSSSATRRADMSCADCSRRPRSPASSASRSRPAKSPAPSPRSKRSSRISRRAPRTPRA
jgi:CBS domain-containing protein